LVGHTVPHAPQFAVSLALSTQAPLHGTFAPGQTQVPAVHMVPVAQMLPQAPQFLLSVA
jgi:hypothetical protein